MKNPLSPTLLRFCGFILLLLCHSQALADQEQWVFLPVAPLFRPLIGDLREPQISILGHLDQSRFEGDLGSFIEFLRYSPGDGTRWGWGILGSGYIQLDENGATFPMKAADWDVGMYLSETSGAFSHRLEFVHQSAHLGDSFQGILNPFFYSRENFNYTFSTTPLKDFRFYTEIGAWINMFPRDKALFASLGAEVYSPPFRPLSIFTRGYFTCHLKWKQEAGGVLNRTFQLGLQLKESEDAARALRLALLFYDGNSEFGEFYRNSDDYWALAVFFDF